MATLMSVKNSAGRRRSCNSRCHDARGQVCRCICQGALHGIRRHYGQSALDETWDERSKVIIAGLLEKGWELQPPLV